MSKSFLAVCIVYTLISVSCSTDTLHKAKSQNKVTTNTSAQFEKQFLFEVNKIRNQSRVCGNKRFAAAPALSLDTRLITASYRHSLDMSKNQFLEHISSNGDRLVERMEDVNYVWSAVGENIAHNQKTISSVLEDWLASPGHCSNLMSSDYTHTGVAVVNRYWTQVYAAPKN